MLSLASMDHLVISLKVMKPLLANTSTYLLLLNLAVLGPLAKIAKIAKIRASLK